MLKSRVPVLASLSDDAAEKGDAPEADRDRPLDPWRRCGTAAARAVIAEAIRLIQNYEDHFRLRKRKRRLADQATFERTVEALLCDAIHGRLTIPTGGLMVSLANRDLGSANRYRAPTLNKALPDILKRLSAPEMAYLNVQKGTQGFQAGEGVRTTISAGERLIRRIEEHSLTLSDITRGSGQETIVLKSAKPDRFSGAELINYRDTPQTRAFREEMGKINAWLAGADISFDEFYATDRVVDSQQRHLRRIFNNGSFAKGGRLFGGFWQEIGKEQRGQGLRIADEPVVTLDYRQAAPRALYGLAGETPPADCYAVPGYESYREGWKKLLNTVLFQGPAIARFPQGTRDLFPARLKIGEALGALLAFHAPVRSRLVPGLGFSLMFTESEILVDVLLDLMCQRIVALPIHDAVIVRRSDQDQAADAMREAFRRHSGIVGEVAVQ